MVAEVSLQVLQCEEFEEATATEVPCNAALELHQEMQGTTYRGHQRRCISQHGKQSI